MKTIIKLTCCFFSFLAKTPSHILNLFVIAISSISEPLVSALLTNNPTDYYLKRTHIYIQKGKQIRERTSTFLTDVLANLRDAEFPCCQRIKLEWAWETIKLQWSKLDFSMQWTGWNWSKPEWAFEWAFEKPTFEWVKLEWPRDDDENNKQ